jgi:DGQHR domain-containing protein
MSLNVNGYTLQEKPLIVCASIPGDWLISHATPSWRLDDPEKGFQRVVSEKRALQIAKTVLDYGRTFPNAIVLATDKNDLRIQDGIVTLPTKIKFLVVDGQHRLWAQKFSENIANYACMIHMGLSEEEMASLFIEINDNQKRVPPSLRWISYALSAQKKSQTQLGLPTWFITLRQRTEVRFISVLILQAKHQH